MAAVICRPCYTFVLLYLSVPLYCMLFTFENTVPHIYASWRQRCGTFHYHWWTASIKPKLIFSPCSLCFPRAFPFSQINYMSGISIHIKINVLYFIFLVTFRFKIAVLKCTYSSVAKIFSGLQFTCTSNSK